MTTIPGLYALGEANFSDHGANRLGASALMQGLADGYFVLPYTIGNYLAGLPYEPIPTTHSAFLEAEEEVKARINKLLAVQGKHPVDVFHKALGKLMWEHCGMARDAAGLELAAQKIEALQAEFWQDVRIIGRDQDLNMGLEKAGRVADFFELGLLMIQDALHRNESCGGHFRNEYQTEEGEAQRNDKDYAYVAAWEHSKKSPHLHKEKLVFEEVTPSQRSYK